MLVSNGQIRLTPVERRQLAGITGIDPVQIKSVEQLTGFIHTQVENIQCRGHAGCLAKRLLLSFLPAETQYASLTDEDGI